MQITSACVITNMLLVTLSGSLKNLLPVNQVLYIVTDTRCDYESTFSRCYDVLGLTFMRIMVVIVVLISLI